MARLAAGELPAGVHVFELGRTAPGLASGMYFARAVIAGDAGSVTRTAGVLVLR